jgi:hypothetical protein
MAKRRIGRGMWCMVGDFNSVLVPEERRGVNVESLLNSEMRGFREFIDEVNLTDLSLLGHRFTWHHANGRSMSRIDKVFVSSEWVDFFGVTSVWVCLRDVSNHSLLVIKNSHEVWGPKPFRFNNFWLTHKNFKKVVEKGWREQYVSGWMSFVLKEKLCGLKPT